MHRKSSEPLTLRVLPTMSLRAFRMKIAKVLKRNGTDIFLSIEVGNGVVRELHSDNDARDLDWLGLEDGSNIVVYSKVQSEQ